MKTVERIVRHRLKCIFVRPNIEKVLDILLDNAYFLSFRQIIHEGKSDDFGLTNFVGPMSNKKTKGRKWYEKRHFLSKMPHFLARHRGFEPLAFGSVVRQKCRFFIVFDR